MIIGGLTDLDGLDLLVVPTAYSLLEGFNARMGRLFRRQPKTSAPALVLVGAAAGNGTTHEPARHDSVMENHSRPSGAAGNGKHAGVQLGAGRYNQTTVAEHNNTTQENQ